MKKHRYNWWPFAINMIEDYPQRKEELKRLREQKITASLSGMPRSGGENRSVESIATRCLPRQEQKEYDAVLLAVNRTKRMKDGNLRMGIVRLTLWGKFKISGAAMQMHISERTATRYRWQFIMLVGRMYNFLSEEEFQKAVKKDNPT